MNRVTNAELFAYSKVIRTEVFNWVGINWLIACQLIRTRD